ncbi:MAG TPA: hypothetical protein VFI98_02375 [Pseudolabrys sp.]|jgi:hypothetical protein|nr:hypothetical protein [Pseudolabrys sp.]
MTGQYPGILAIWNNCRAGREGEFETWFQGEHLLERLAVPGFLFGRRHQALSGTAGYFNFYLVESPGVLTSKPYLERLDNPTPMTKLIMSEVFLNMNRTVCRRTVRRGGFRGAYTVTARFNIQPDETELHRRLDMALQDTAIAGGEIWIALDPAGMPVSMEEKLRGGDRKIKGALMVDTLRQRDAEMLGEKLASEFPAAEVGVFRVLCQLGNGDL